MLEFQTILTYRAWHSDDGEGQALALRYRTPFFRTHRFRSFRTYMSIAARVVPFSRSFRSFIKTRADLVKTIKDLKDLRALRSPSAIDIKVLRT